MQKIDYLSHPGPGQFKFILSTDAEKSLTVAIELHRRSTKNVRFVKKKRYSELIRSQTIFTQLLLLPQKPIFLPLQNTSQCGIYFTKCVRYDKTSAISGKNLCIYW
jgi:hypothetical protein